MHKNSVSGFRIEKLTHKVLN